MHISLEKRQHSNTAGMKYCYGLQPPTKRGVVGLRHIDFPLYFLTNINAGMIIVIRDVWTALSPATNTWPVNNNICKAEVSYASSPDAMQLINPDKPYVYVWTLWQRMYCNVYVKTIAKLTPPTVLQIWSHMYCMSWRSYITYMNWLSPMVWLV